MAKRYVELPQRKTTQTISSSNSAKEESKAPDINSSLPLSPSSASSLLSVDNNEEGVDVVYQLERIAIELTASLHNSIVESKKQTDESNDISSQKLSDEFLPRALVMTQGKAAKQVFLAIAEAGIASVAPITGDWRLDVNPKLAFTSVKLGQNPARALFSNAHALLTAANEANVQAIFLGGASLSLGRDNRFLVRASQNNIRVFMPLELDPTRQRWIECETNKDTATQPTTWRTCHHCKLAFDDEEFKSNDYKCPNCHTLARLSSDERIELVLDKNSFEEWDTDLADLDPLNFPGYVEKIASQRQRTGKDEAVRTGKGTIGGFPTAIGFMESAFFMGSMGSIVGEKVARLFDRATEENLPVVMFCASGGARMQEGLASLMQMAKTACAVERHDRAGLLYVSVLTDPTTGGVTASFATLGDIIFAEPAALIGFAGQRVIRDTIKQELPEGFQTAEFALNHGLIDAIVKRSSLRTMLKNTLALHSTTTLKDYSATDDEIKEQPIETISLPADKERFPLAELFQNPIEKLPFADRVIKRSASNIEEEKDNLDNTISERDKKKLERHAKRELKRSGLTANATPGSAWESVQLARNVHRPTARTYIKGIVEGFIELHGDRSFADDEAIVGGIGRIGNTPVTIIAQEKGSDLQDRIRRNFGCPQPEGYRKSARLMRQAEKFGRPIVCFVDTQGAFCGTEAEERGQGNAIAENLALMAGLHVPVISILLGEGGSGGALALAVSNRVAMQQHAVYSVLSPEGFASILWKDGKRAPEAAEVMGMNSTQVLKLGVVDDIISEGSDAAHKNPDQAVENVRAYIEEALNELSGLTPTELLTQRQERFARF